MPNAIHTALLFLIETLCSLYLFVLMIRIVLVWIRSDYFNPLTQFIVKLTNAFVKPLRRILPNIYRLELASVVLAFLLGLIKFSLLAYLNVGLANVLGLSVLSLGDMLATLLQVFTYAILLQALLSFVQPFSPINIILHRFTAPIMQPLQRIIPPIAGLDLSPIPALIGLQLLSILIVNPLMAWGQGIAFN